MSAPSRIAYLDGFRVIALALVFLDHLSNNRAIAAFYDAHGLRFLADYGEVGVFIFFFISGRVVSESSLRQAQRDGSFDIGGFYLRRLFRIAPPLMLYLGACLLLGFAGAVDVAPAQFFSAALSLCNTAAPMVSCNWYVGHTWSLAFETQFYLLFPLLFVWAERGKAPAPASLLLVAPMILAPIIFPVWWIGVSGAAISYALFLAGYFIAKAPQRLETAAWRRPALLVAAAVVLAPRTLIAIFGETESARAALIDAYRPLYVFAIPALVTLAGAPGSRMERVLGGARLAALGRATYSIYLWQQLVTAAPFHDAGAATQLAALAAVVALCIPLHTRFETRFIDLGRRLARRRRHALGPASWAQAPAPQTPGA